MQENQNAEVKDGEKSEPIGADFGSFVKFMQIVSTDPKLMQDLMNVVKDGEMSDELAEVLGVAPEQKGKTEQYIRENILRKKSRNGKPTVLSSVATFTVIYGMLSVFVMLLTCFPQLIGIERIGNAGVMLAMLLPLSAILSYMWSKKQK